MSNYPIAGTVAQIDELEQQFIIRKAVSMISRDQGCTPAEAIAHICRDWMELREVEVLSPNVLANSTPVDFKPTWADRLKQIF